MDAADKKITFNIIRLQGTKDEVAERKKRKKEKCTTAKTTVKSVQLFDFLLKRNHYPNHNCLKLSNVK